MSEQEHKLIPFDFNPTFLFTWKGQHLEDDTPNVHDHLEIAFIISGKGHYCIDGITYETSEGDLFIVNSGTNHYALAADSDDPAVELFVGAADFQLIGMEPNTLPLIDGSPIVHTTGDARTKLHRIATLMEAENSIYWEGRYYVQRSYMEQMMLIYLKEYIHPVPATPREIKSVNKKYVVDAVEGYFEEHYAEHISLDLLAESMYLSPFYISRIFKSETGDTPIRHLIDIRLDKAMEALRSTAMSVSEVAASVGYDDVSHFSKLFKKRFGCPPSKARK